MKKRAEKYGKSGAAGPEDPLDALTLSEKMCLVFLAKRTEDVSNVLEGFKNKYFKVYYEFQCSLNSKLTYYHVTAFVRTNHANKSVN